MKRRFDKNRFFGLPVTLLFLAVLYTVFLFAGIVEDVITANVITSLDIRFSNLFAMFRDGDMTRFFLFITMLGKWYTVLIFITATMGTLFVWGKKIYIIPLLLAVIGSEAFTFLGKIIIHRARPEMAMYIEHSFSFPSGHATIALAFYGFLVYMIFRSASTRKMKINTIFIGGTIIFLIGFSRLYLGVHYVSDVVGGYLVGAIWLMIGISVSEWIRSMKFEEKLNYSRYKAKTYTIILILLSFIFYLLVAAQYSPNILSNAIIQKSLNGDKVDDVFYKETDKFTKTLFGNTQEPISFMLYAKNDIELKKIFNNAGWYLSDEASLSSMFEISKAVLINGQYLRAPMTPSFWNKLPNGFGFEKPDKSNGVRQRHHVRFWKTDYVTTTGKRVYVGTASFDSGIKWGITHRINPSIDSEREFLFQDLKSTGKIMKYKKQKLVEPTLGQNFSGDQFFTDGKMYIVDFK
ncbi:MAG TPA: phosphatase PAP2 family protein [Ignavibacteria bacterium]|nr:phosphatase PAP2 family protein [Ignavibacteria bacterium]